MPRNVFRFVSMFFFAACLYAQQAESPEVLIRTFPESPAAGEKWTLTLLVDHPVPDEVTVLAPAFPSSFTLDQIRKAGKTGVDAKRQTEIEYSFFTGGAGEFTIQPFTVITQAGRARTKLLTVSVRGTGAVGQIPRPVLRWIDSPAKTRAGEAAFVSLVLSGWDLPFPDADFFAPPAQNGVIIETAARSGEDMRASVVLRLTLIPLKTAPLYFPPRTLVYNGVEFRVPPLSIAVDPAPAAVPSVPAAETTVSRNGGEPPRAAHGFPAFETPLERGGLYRLLFYLGNIVSGGAYETVYQTAENLWSRAYYAEALALLRRSERDHALGLLFFSLRIQAEQNLDMHNTGNETPRAPIAAASIFLFALSCVFFAFRVLKKRPKKMRALTAALVFLLPILYFASPLYDIASPLTRRSGIAMQAGIRLVPDLSAEQTALLAEGCPVKTGRQISARGQTPWLWIETNNAARLSGWAPAEKIIKY